MLQYLIGLNRLDFLGAADRNGLTVRPAPSARALIAQAVFRAVSARQYDTALALVEAGVDPCAPPPRGSRARSLPQIHVVVHRHVGRAKERADVGRGLGTGAGCGVGQHRPHEE